MGLFFQFLGWFENPRLLTIETHSYVLFSDPNEVPSDEDYNWEEREASRAHSVKFTDDVMMSETGKDGVSVLVNLDIHWTENSVQGKQP